MSAPTSDDLARHTPPPWLHGAFFSVAMVLPLTAVASVLLAPHRSWSWAVAVLLAVALAERLWPRSLPPLAPGDHALALRGLLRMYVPLHLAMLGAGAWAAQQAGDWLVVCSVAALVGLVAGAQGISYAHELGHSHRRGDRALAWLLMALVAYPQFMVEHYRGHHVRVATPDDPASARRGESLWRFLPRTVYGSLVHALALERGRLRHRRGRNWPLHSPLAWVWAGILAAVLVLWALGATKIIVFLVLQALLAVGLLETVNYIEHYGLQRQRSSGGAGGGDAAAFEPVAAHHAWNADCAVSNALLANLQRHSDHHLHAGTPFAALRSLSGPQLPSGYAGCLLLALVPPLWRALMHPRLEALSTQAPAARQPAQQCGLRQGRGGTPLG